MEIEIYARRRNYPSGTKYYKRKLKAESIIRKDNRYQITFSWLEYERFKDFNNKLIQQRNVNGSYSFHIVENGKWFETKLVEQQADESSTFYFEVYNEDSVLNACCLEM